MKNNNDENKKTKKTNAQKRLIAGYIAMYCFMGALVSTLPGFIVADGYKKDIKELDNEQNAIYEQFMASEEFSDSFKQEFTKTSNDYANGLITYEEFDKKVKHLNSVEYAQKVLATSNNSLKAQAEVIDQKKEERREEYLSNPVVDISLGAMLAGTAASAGFIIASGVYGIKEINEQKRKRASNKIKHQEYETGDVLIDKKVTTYYVYDHKETKTPNAIEEESDKNALSK